MVSKKDMRSNLTFLQNSKIEDCLRPTNLNQIDLNLIKGFDLVTRKHILDLYSSEVSIFSR